MALVEGDVIAMGVMPDRQKQWRTFAEDRVAVSEEGSPAPRIPPIPPHPPVRDACAAVLLLLDQRDQKVSEGIIPHCR